MRTIMMIIVKGALQHEKNKVSLRNLSMTLRQVPAGSGEDKIGNVEQGLVKGKEAVSLDTTDGQSWSLLGNAYLSHFFQVIFISFYQLFPVISGDVILMLLSFYHFRRCYQLLALTQTLRGWSNTVLKGFLDNAPSFS